MVGSPCITIFAGLHLQPPPGLSQTQVAGRLLTAGRQHHRIIQEGKDLSWRQKTVVSGFKDGFKHVMFMQFIEDLQEIFSWFSGFSLMGDVHGVVRGRPWNFPGFVWVLVDIQAPRNVCQ